MSLLQALQVARVVQALASNETLGAFLPMTSLERQPKSDDQLRVEAIRSPAELQELWAIDNAAYGEASITYEKFLDWWSSFPLGLWALFYQKRVMGAIGIWPLSIRTARLLKSAKLKESHLSGTMMRRFTQRPTRFWYVSGLVLQPQLAGSRAIRTLFSEGIGSWLRRTKIEFPCQLLTLAYLAESEVLLETFRFSRIQNATAMPDHVPLFCLELSTREQCILLLKDRGLEVT
jgi:hypothetical protein